MTLLRLAVGALVVASMVAGCSGSATEPVAVTNDRLARPDLIGTSAAATPDDRLVLAPVVALLPIEEDCSEPPGDTGSGQSVVQFRDGTFCLVLGAVRLDDRHVERATVTRDAIGLWGIDIQLSPIGSVELDVAADLCFKRDATICPSGQLAIVVGGVVQSAPTVNAPSFDGGIRVIGPYAEADVREWASLLS